MSLPLKQEDKSPDDVLIWNVDDLFEDDYNQSGEAPFDIDALLKLEQSTTPDEAPFDFDMLQDKKEEKRERREERNNKYDDVFGSDASDPDDPEEEEEEEEKKEATTNNLDSIIQQMATVLPSPSHLLSNPKQTVSHAYADLFQRLNVAVPTSMSSNESIDPFEKILKEVYYTLDKTETDSKRTAIANPHTFYGSDTNLLKSSQFQLEYRTRQQEDEWLYESHRFTNEFNTTIERFSCVNGPTCVVKRHAEYIQVDPTNAPLKEFVTPNICSIGFLKKNVCVLCARNDISNLYISFVARQADIMSLDICLQRHYNSQETGQYADWCLLKPGSTFWNGLMAPVVAYRPLSLIWRFNTERGLWYIDQSTHRNHGHSIQDVVPDGNTKSAKK